GVDAIRLASKDELALARTLRLDTLNSCLRRITGEWSLGVDFVCRAMADCLDNSKSPTDAVAPLRDLITRMSSKQTPLDASYITHAHVQEAWHLVKWSRHPDEFKEWVDDLITNMKAVG